MSRIGKKPIPIPDGVTVRVDACCVTATGPRGTQEVVVRPEMTVKQENDELRVSPKGHSRLHRSLHGLTRTLLANALAGVYDGFTKQLEIKGVGYRAAVEDEKLVLHLGFSHPVEFTIPEGIKVEVKKNLITISGNDKQLVGETAARLRRLRPPEPYKGKGIKYTDEVIRRKAGKAAKAAAAAVGGAAK